MNEDEDDNEDNEKDEAEIRGIVTGAASGHACPAFTFTVGSTSVTTSARTKFEHTTCAGVINGISVKVEGRRTSPAAIAATKSKRGRPSRATTTPAEQRLPPVSACGAPPAPRPTTAWAAECRTRRAETNHC